MSIKDEEILAMPRMTGMFKTSFKELTKSRKGKVGNYRCSASGLCMRKQYFDYTNKIKVGRPTQNVFLLGHWHHYLIQSNYNKVHGDNCTIEYSLESLIDGIHVTGHIDILLHDIARIIDIKTTSNLYNIKGISEKHEKQLNMYAYLYHLMTGIKIKELSIIYQDSYNEEKHKIYSIKPNEQIALAQIEEFKSLHNSLESRDVPVWNVAEGDEWMCYRCQYLSICNEMDAGFEDVIIR